MGWSAIDQLDAEHPPLIIPFRIMATRASVVKGIFLTSEKIGLTQATFLSYILPPLVCHYLMGVLVQLSGTRLYRLTLIPVMVWLAWRATFVDLSGGDTESVQSNTMLITLMASFATRSAVWAFARVRYHRHSPIHKQSRLDSESIGTACWNTWDLMLNPRGIGWNWPRGLVIPKPVPDTDSRVIFVLLSATRAVFNAVGFDACTQGIRILSPETFGSHKGGSLFDESLPPVAEFLRAVFVSVLAASSPYFGVQYSYHCLAILCVILFHQHPSQWPPLFDAPWLSTSLAELWGRRWHQMMRDIVLNLGGQPFGYLFGGYGVLFGSFLASGIFHDIEARSPGRGGNSMIIIGFWMMNGVGIILERAWEKATGKRVGGVWGRLWLAMWLVLWGVPTVNVYMKVGRYAAIALPGRLEPSLVLVRAFVAVRSHGIRLFQSGWCTIGQWLY